MVAAIRASHCTAILDWSADQSRAGKRDALHSLIEPRAVLDDFDPEPPRQPNHPIECAAKNCVPAGLMQFIGARAGRGQELQNNVLGRWRETVYVGTGQDLAVSYFKRDTPSRVQNNAVPQTANQSIGNLGGTGFGRNAEQCKAYVQLAPGYICGQRERWRRTGR